MGDERQGTGRYGPTDLLRLASFAIAVLAICGLLYWYRDDFLGCNGSVAWARSQPCDPKTPLEIVLEAERRPIDGGSAVLFIVSGRIANRTAETQRVPDIYFEVLSNAGSRGSRGVVGDWRIAPPVSSLAPGKSAPVTGTLRWSDQAHSLDLKFGRKHIDIDLDPDRPLVGSKQQLQLRTKVYCSPKCVPAA